MSLVREILDTQAADEKEPFDRAARTSIKPLPLGRVLRNARLYGVVVPKPRPPKK